MDSNHRPLSRGSVFIAEGELLGDRTARQKIWRGTDGSNPSPSSGESRTNHELRRPALRPHRCALGSLRGKGPATHLPEQPATYPVPIYLGALTSPTVELAGEVADGLMPFLWSAERIARSTGARIPFLWDF